MGHTEIWPDIMLNAFGYLMSSIGNRYAMQRNRDSYRMESLQHALDLHCVRFSLCSVLSFSFPVLLGGALFCSSFCILFSHPEDLSIKQPSTLKGGPTPETTATDQVETNVCQPTNYLTAASKYRLHILRRGEPPKMRSPGLGG
jgi:hypothetical protein